MATWTVGYYNYYFNIMVWQHNWENFNRTFYYCTNAYVPDFINHTGQSDLSAYQVDTGVSWNYERDVLTTGLGHDPESNSTEITFRHLVLGASGALYACWTADADFTIAAATTYDFTFNNGFLLFPV